jgi:hypothetical protein
LRERCASNEPGPHPRELLQVLPVVRNFKLLNLRLHAIKKKVKNAMIKFWEARRIFYLPEWKRNETKNTAGR